MNDKELYSTSLIPSFFLSSHSPYFSPFSFLLCAFKKSSWNTEQEGEEKERRIKWNEACLDKTGIISGNGLLKCWCPLAVLAPGGRVTNLTEEASHCSGFCAMLDLSSTEGNGTPLQYSCLEKSHGLRSLVGYSQWGHKESDTTDWLHFFQVFLHFLHLHSSPL